MKNSYVTVTRDGDNFTYQHRNDSKGPVTLDLDRLISTASFMNRVHDRNVSALYFLRNAIEAHANAGKDFDAYESRGIAAICDCIIDATIYQQNEYSAEIGTFEKLSER